MLKIILTFLCGVCILYPSNAHAIFHTSAKYALIMDYKTGDVLYEKRGYEKMPPASMSKLMTLYVIFSVLKDGIITLDDKFLISKKSWAMGGSKMFLPEGGRVTVEDLLRGVIVQSGNDATIALAEGVAGTEEAFVDMMNNIAESMGLSQSNFANVHGITHPEHYSSPYDLAKLSRMMITNFPEYYKIFREKVFTFNKIKQYNRNSLIGKEGVDGIKTGHTQASGYGIISSAIQNGKRLIVIVNGLKSKTAREIEVRNLLRYGFRNFRSINLIEKGSKIVTIPTWLGQKSHIPLLAKDSLSVIVPKDRYKDLKLFIEYNTPIMAPAKKGDIYGTLTLKYEGLTERQVDLVLSEDMNVASYHDQFIQKLKYYFQM